MLTLVDRILDYRLALAWRILILLVVIAIPFGYVARHYSPTTGFTSLIYFGRDFAPGSLDEVKAIDHAAEFPAGYDGQFYAQVAIKPLLNDPQLRLALDAPTYRAERIFFPAVAYLLGFGKPSWILQVYATLNLAFWLALLLGLVHYLQARTVKDYLCVLAVVLTAGSLFSIHRALTDLPAATLGFYGAACTEIVASCAICLAVLTKQTSIFMAGRFAWPLPKDRQAVSVLLGRLGLIVIPYLCWMFYVRYMFHSKTYSGSVFGWPLKGWLSYIHASWHTLRATPVAFLYGTPSHWEWCLFELLAPLSVMFQALYLCVRPKLNCPYWRTGIGFAVLFFFFRPILLETQIGFCRIVLPMTIAFNIQLMRARGGAFLLPFGAGNIGLVFALRQTVACCLQ